MKRRQLLQMLGALPFAGLIKSKSEDIVEKSEKTKSTSAHARRDTPEFDYDLRPPNPELTFSSFLVMRDNEEVHRVAYGISTGFYDHKVNPLILEGNNGNGTTHLAHAMANEMQKLKPNARVHVISAERFLNQCVNAVRKQNLDKFKKFYRESLDVLIVDDFQYIERGELTQTEMLHVIKELREKSAQVILTTDARLKDRLLTNELKDFLSGGVTLELGMPDYKGRVSLVRYFNEKYNARLSEKDIYKHAQRQQSIRALQGAVYKLKLLGDFNV